MFNRDPITYEPVKLENFAVLKSAAETYVDIVG
ncbi:hypothetical protein cgp_1124 [Corynebacterium glutamicum MB001]|nr:hypothetical protein cgp_1124 [Corynebacterium glutamicum MB001]ASW13678.1 hypothetical protein cgc1_1124 [Corynebacterium glutamicum]QYO73218.1 hypothetical protein cgisf_1124 [Corynebacterium glutamicum]